MALCLSTLIATRNTISQTEFQQIVKQTVAEFKVPGMAACVVNGDQAFVTAVAGVRKLGDKAKIKPTDLFSLGSCTKSMTATLAAMCVEEGKVRWDSKLTEVFPGWNVNTALRNVTLEDLLYHRAGLRPDLVEDDMARYAYSAEPPMANRKEAVAKLLAEDPVRKPGSEFLYSNLGYTTVGVALETILHKPWEDLVRERVFKPLGMASAGFGPIGSRKKVDQPWGHESKPDKPYTPFPPGPESENPSVIGPAATVHCCIEDLARYAKFHLRGAQGRGKLLSASSFERLRTDHYKQGYAMGWVVVDQGWTKGVALNHNGSNTMSSSLMWIVPGQDFAIVVSTNAGDSNAFKACNNVVAEVAKAQFSH